MRYLTKREAERDAVSVKAYWMSEGKKISVWVEKIGKHDFAVRSDMMNGLPRERWQ